MDGVNIAALTHVLTQKSCVWDAATDSVAKTVQICQQEDARLERKFESTSNPL